MPHTTDNSWQTMTAKLRAERSGVVRRVAEILADIDTLPAIATGGNPLPSGERLGEIVGLCRLLLFPGFFGSTTVTRDNVGYHLGVEAESLLSQLTAQIAAALRFTDCCMDTEAVLELASRKAAAFLEALPEMRRVLQVDVDATFDGDPAATSKAEVVFSYPGFRATISYRIAHALHQLEVPVIPRMVSEMAHSETGIDIHPAASIGEGLMIDHGTGVVIGATSIIGRNVKIYQGVTLGARSFVRDADNNLVKGVARHPIVGNNVVIYSNATILGHVTIGDGAVIGGNLWITENVAPGERLVQAAPDNIIRLKH